MFAPKVLVAVIACASGLRRARKGATTCGIKGESSPSFTEIVNGDDATECEWPWQVSLTRPHRFLGSGWQVPITGICGGTLISPEWVLTAAHCVTWAKNPVIPGLGLEVVLGSHLDKADGNQQKIAAANTYVHPSFGKKFDWRNSTYDIALIRLEKPAKITSCVRPACLPTGGDVEQGAKCWITGWGSTPGQFEVLQEAEVKIWSNKACSGDKIDDTMMCAQGGKFFVGRGYDADRGGPLVCEGAGGWTVYGVTSWGTVDVGIWSRVHKSLAWIESTMANAPAQAPEVARCLSTGSTANATSFVRPSYVTDNTLPDEYGRCYCSKNIEDTGYGKCLETCAPPPTNPSLPGGVCRTGAPVVSRSNWTYLLGCATCKCYTQEEFKACIGTSTA